MAGIFKQSTIKDIIQWKQTEKEDDMIVLFSLTNTDPPLHGELEKHLSEVKEQVSRISSIKPVHKIHIPNGYVMTTRPELWDGYKLDAKSTVF